MKTIREQVRQKVMPLAAQLKQNHQALAAAVKTGDTSQIQALSKTQGDLRGQALTIRSEAMAQVYAELTPDQRQKLDAIRQRLQQRRLRPGIN
jgi:Spy/CpxP family protein refolding chaperone